MNEIKEQAQAMLSEDMAKITALDPDITSLEQLEGDEELKKKVESGVGLFDAWFLKNRKAIIERAVNDALEKEREARRATAHLKVSEKRGENMTEIPASVMELYAALMPEEDRHAFMKSYQKYKNNH